MSEQHVAQLLVCAFVTVQNSHQCIVVYGNVHCKGFCCAHFVITIVKGQFILHFYYT